MVGVVKSLATDGGKVRILSISVLCKGCFDLFASPSLLIVKENRGKSMKVANWNIEWMNRWFLPDTETPAFRTSEQISGVTDIDDLCRRVADVLEGLEADVITLQEGPSRKEEMLLYMEQYLDNAYELFGPTGKGQQKLYTLVKRGGAAQDATRTFTTGEVKFAEGWLADVDGDMTLSEYNFTREPLLVDVTERDSGKRIRIINVHLKSKYVHDGERLWKNEARRSEFVRMALLARRRISTEAMRLREYFNELLETDPLYPVILCGDCNDGPGNDYFERYYLTHNLVAIMLGNPFQPQQMFRHALIGMAAPVEEAYTAIFDDYIDEVSSRKLLLDHILVSPGLFGDLADGKVEHALYEANIALYATGRQWLPSDHRPQSVIL